MTSRDKTWDFQIGLQEPVRINFNIRYKSECTAAKVEDYFLNKLNLAKLNAALDSPITREEILESIRTLPTAKASSQDGFTAEFWKYDSFVITRKISENYEKGKLTL